MEREESWVLVGRRRGRLWLMTLVDHREGEAASVAFDGAAALRREEEHGDVLGFLHTHPGFHAEPSLRDVRTMRAWSSCFGKPLLCAIRSGDLWRGFVFPDDESSGTPLEALEPFGPESLIGLEHLQR